MQTQDRVHAIFALLVATLPGCDASAGDDGGASGSGTIAGAYAGRSFDSVGASYRIGRPDDPERTVVIYVFDVEVACDEISAPGWDARIGDGVQSLELKLVGTTPAQFAVSTAPTPAQGQAAVNYTATSTTQTPAEVGASGGTVSLEGVADGTARGSFALIFGGHDMLTGSFDAARCAGGTEP